MPITIKLLSNKRHIFQNRCSNVVIMAEHNATEITVSFPEEYENYSKRVDFLTARNEGWTEMLYCPEFKEYPEGYDKLVFKFKLPNDVTYVGELRMQFLAYKPDESLTCVPFEIVPIEIVDGIMTYKKAGAKDPDLIILSYNKSESALFTAQMADNTANESNARSIESLANSESAVMSAEHAVETASTALDTSEEANRVAVAAFEQSGEAFIASENAVNIASSARATATLALETAEQIAGDSLKVATEAKQTADSAAEVADGANKKSDSATLTANNASGKADQAVATSDAAKALSQAAETHAVSADVKADDALNKAILALNNSATALEQSTEAVEIASAIDVKAVQALAQSGEALGQSSSATTLAVEAKATASSAETKAGTAYETAMAIDAKAQSAVDTAAVATATATSAQTAVASLELVIDGTLTDITELQASSVELDTTLQAVRGEAAVADAKAAMAETHAQSALNGLDGKIDKVDGKGLSSEDYSASDKAKLAGIEEGAKNYAHPLTHPPSVIEQDTENRFTTDTEKAKWNAYKQPHSVSVIVAPYNAVESSKAGADIVLVGDSTDSELINGAITTLTNGGEIAVLEGTVNCAKTININSNITIRGRGNSTIFLKNFNGVLFSAVEKESVLVTDFKIDANSFPGQNVLFSTVDKCRAENLYISGGALGISVEMCNAAMVVGCTILSSSHSLSISQSTYSCITRVHCNSASGSALYSANTFSTHFAIADSVFLGAGTNVVFLRRLQNSRITGCHIESTGGAAFVSMQFCSYTVVANNTLKSLNTKFSVVSGNYNLVIGNISNCEISTTESATILINNLRSDMPA